MRLKQFTFILCLFFCISSVFNAKATHIIGGEIGYTFVSGYTYEITLTLYGDCAGSSFPSLPSAIPRVEVYKDNNPFSYLDLTLTGPGVEVTPVCPAEAGNTTCVNPLGTIPGVTRFIFKGIAVLDGPAVQWAFLFNSQLGGNAGAGRTNAITNILSGSRIALEATLNNTSGPNNSSIFTTIPTPFFCINLPQEYNQGAADPDGDQLSFSLVPGIDVDNAGNVIGSVGYIPPYTYLNPLATTPGSFNFNTSSGQMSFIPNLQQTSLVVNMVTEKRGGVIVGTCMREMNLVVLDNCTNQPPYASIPTSTISAFDSSRTISFCYENLNPQFVIDVSDADLQNVTVSVTGLPSTASYAVSGNGTTHPVITIQWNIPQPTAPGIFNFYVNCQDNGCPLSSKQTFAYTVIQLQPIAPLGYVTTKETCVPGNDGLIQISSSSTNGPLVYSIDGINYQNSFSFAGLSAGNYTVTVKDSAGCVLSATIPVDPSPTPLITYATSPESCLPGQDGSIVINANSVNGVVTGYSLNGGAPQVSNIFSNLISGVYTISAQDTAGCVGTETIILTSSPIPEITAITQKNVSCYGESDASIQLNITPSGLNCIYLLQPGNVVTLNGVFENLGKGIYTITVTTDKYCSDTAIVSITEPDQFLITALDIQLATCERNNAKIQVKTNYTGSLIYTLRPATYINTDGFFTDVTPGFYTVTVRDSNFCTVDSAIYVGALPNLFTSSITHTDLQCNGWGTEGEAEVNASGGVEPYTYLWTTNPPSANKRISNLYYGWYFVDVTDATGCETKDTVYISPGSCCENVYIPNAFTPNNDGQNDEWRMVTSTGLIVDQFAVYNRWGEQIWHTSNQRGVWDGKRNGGDVESGTYFYLLRYECLSDGKKYVKKGDVTVLR